MITLMTDVKQLKNAIEKCAKEKIVAGKGISRDTGKTIFIVASTSETKKAGHPVYRIVTKEDNDDLRCTCTGSKYSVCKHEGAAYQKFNKGKLPIYRGLR